MKLTSNLHQLAIARLLKEKAVKRVTFDKAKFRQ